MIAGQVEDVLPGVMVMLVQFHPRFITDQRQRPLFKEAVGAGLEDEAEIGNRRFLRRAARRA